MASPASASESSRRMVLAGKGLSPGSGRCWVGSGLDRPRGYNGGRPRDVTREARTGHRARLRSCPFRSAPVAGNGAYPLEGVAQMRRYELMLVLRPDVADDKSQAIVDRTTRGIVAAGGQIIKVAPWGRRRLAYPIDRHREGSYQIILFEAPPDAITELEHTLLITEEVLRHLVTRVDRPAKASAGDGSELADIHGEDLPSGLDEEDEDIPGEFIDESESEAAPAAID